MCHGPYDCMLLSQVRRGFVLHGYTVIISKLNSDVRPDLMYACMTSCSSLHVEETLSTLSYATRAKNIQNRPVVQYDPKEQQIASLRKEIDLLRQV